jgi:hypothetical protein
VDVCVKSAELAKVLLEINGEQLKLAEVLTE